MNRNRMSQIAKRTGRIAVVCLLAVFLFLVFTDVSQAENPPRSMVYFMATVMRTATYSSVSPTGAVNYIIDLREVTCMLP
jgi:hypothetical protein